LLPWSVYPVFVGIGIGIELKWDKFKAFDPDGDSNTDADWRN
jgi:hypothetical protein